VYTWISHSNRGQDIWAKLRRVNSSVLVLRLDLLSSPYSFPRRGLSILRAGGDQSEWSWLWSTRGVRKFVLYQFSGRAGISRRIPHTFFNNTRHDDVPPLFCSVSSSWTQDRKKDHRGESTRRFCRNAPGILKIRHYRSTSRSCATSKSMKRLHIAALATEISPCNIAEHWLRCSIACLVVAGSCSRVAANSRACST